MVSRTQRANVELLPLETRELIDRDSAKVLCAVMSFLADKNTRTTIISNHQLMRKARFGLPGVEAAQTALHRAGLLDIEMQSWDIVNPCESRFRYTLPENSTNIY